MSSTAATLAQGVSQRHRESLMQLHRGANAAFDVAEASEILHLDRERTARLLGYLARRGWLSRVRRGLYVTVPLDARRSGEWIEDPWIVAHRVFAPCYIGGWTACEHWDLTEQLFRTVAVVSAGTVRRSDLAIQSTRYHVTTRSPEMLFGTSGVWHEQTRVQVSDPSRTVIDILDSPPLGGGIRHVADVLNEYFDSPHRDDTLLVEYGDRVGNRTIFKRMGFLLEERAEVTNAGSLIEACKKRVSRGVTALDPSSEAKGRIVRRWGLRVNVDVSTEDVA